MNDSLQELISIQTLSQRYEIPEKTLRKWVYQKAIPYHKLGKLVRFNVQEIRAWCEGKKVSPLTPSVLRDRIPCQ